MIPNRPVDVGRGSLHRVLEFRKAPMNEVTRILSAIRAGDARAAEALLPLVYDELRKLAAVRMAQEAPGNTLDATALVHEAYLRLVGADPARPWDGRAHFFAAAATAMRRILVERARLKGRILHGGGRRRTGVSVKPALIKARPQALRKRCGVRGPPWDNGPHSPILQTSGVAAPPPHGAPGLRTA
jgi:hypothetical protein